MSILLQIIQMQTLQRVIIQYEEPALGRSLLTRTLYNTEIVIRPLFRLLDSSETRIAELGQTSFWKLHLLMLL